MESWEKECTERQYTPLDNFYFFECVCECDCGGNPFNTVHPCCCNCICDFVRGIPEERCTCRCYKLGFVAFKDVMTTIDRKTLQKVFHEFYPNHRIVREKIGEDSYYFSFQPKNKKKRLLVYRPLTFTVIGEEK